MNYDLRICEFAVTRLRIIPLVDMWRIPINGVCMERPFCIRWLWCAGVAADGLSFFIGCALNFCCYHIVIGIEVCEELEKDVGGRIWLDMMIVYCRRECQLCDLEKEAREIAFEIEAFLLKLMDEEPSHKRVFGGDDGQIG
ncbi:hypothetical protein Tco_0092898 [Tanacetum coccineum]